MPTARHSASRADSVTADESFLHRDWTELVNRHLPSMWDATSAVDAPLEVRHEACVLAWLRLAQRHEIASTDQAGEWLVTTARLEAERALVRLTVKAQQSTSPLSMPAKGEQE